MASRIEIELTSDRGDGTWTWRAAGAKNPKGILDGTVLPSGPSVGDVFTAEADYGIDGIDIVSVQEPKAKERPTLETIEVIGSKRNEQLVTTKLAKSEGRGRGRGRGRDGRPGGDRRGGGRGGDGRRDNRAGVRLRPQSFNRDAMVEVLPENQRDQARAFIDSGETGNLPEPVVESLKAAEWRDRADAATANVEKADLRDLRSVVAASVTHAASDDSKALAESLRSKVNARVDKEQQAWLADLNTAIGEKRAIRALRQSARPVRLGVPLSDHVAKSLVELANNAFEPELDAERWGSLLDAVAFSPVRGYVVPANMPEDPNDKELVTALRKLADRVPQIAAMFGIKPPEKSEKGKGKKDKADSAKAEKSEESVKAEKPEESPKADDVELAADEVIITEESEDTPATTEAATEQE